MQPGYGLITVPSSGFVFGSPWTTRPGTSNNAPDSPLRVWETSKVLEDFGSLGTIMVGIPGKSKGCNTCRRRKKGCDLQRPVCGQCQKSSLHCAGYNRDTIWVSMTPEAGSLRRHTNQKSSDVTLVETFARSAYHEQYLGLFWNSYLPNGRAFPLESSQYTTGVWMNELHRLFRMDNQLALRQILLAIALTSIGERDKKPWMVENGLKLYGSSLATFAGQIEDRNGVVSNSGIVISRILSLYEILHGHDHQERIGQTRNWYFHLKGELGFLLSRGPESYTTGFAHQLFVDGRMAQISSSIAGGSKSILNEPEWKTIPWREIPKTAKDLLGDIFAELPALVLELGELRSATDHNIKETLSRDLIQKCLRLEDEWLTWGQESAPVKSPVAPNTIQPTQVFDHIVAAHIMSSYWSIGVFIYATLHLASGTQASAATLGWRDPRICCRKIAELLPTFLNPYCGSFGVHGAIFPSIVALQYLDGVDGGATSADTRAFYDVFVNGKNGRIIRRFVDNMRQQLEAQGLRLFAPVS